MWALGLVKTVNRCLKQGKIGVCADNLFKLAQSINNDAPKSAQNFMKRISSYSLANRQDQNTLNKYYLDREEAKFFYISD